MQGGKARLLPALVHNVKALLQAEEEVPQRNEWVKCVGLCVRGASWVTTQFMSEAIFEFGSIKTTVCRITLFWIIIHINT